MARPATALLLVLLTLVAALPMASAAVGLPPPVGKTERISYYSWQTGPSYCGSWDPALGIVGLALPSEVTTESVPGGTRYAFHLEMLAAPEECPTIDVSFDMSGAAWPSQQVYQQVSSPCGASGWAWYYPHTEGMHFQFWLNLPEACDAGIVGVVGFHVNVQPAHPSEYMACAPTYVLVGSCVGAAEYREEQYTCPNGQRPAGTFVTLVLYADRRCDWQNGGQEDVVYVSPLAGVVWIEARESSCKMFVSDPFLGEVDESVDCPEAVHAFVYETEWGNVLP